MKKNILGLIGCLVCWFLAVLSFLILVFAAEVAYGENLIYPTTKAAICPLYVPENEVWEATYIIVTTESSWHDPCSRQTWGSAWVVLGPGQYDVPEYPNTVFIIWFIRPLVSCTLFWYNDCIRPEITDETQWVWPQFDKVCPDWDAFPGYGSVCLFDDGFESGDASTWSKEVP